MAKAIQITEEAYAELVRGKEVALQQVRRAGDHELAGALMAMGIGAFAGWLIYKGLRELEKDSQVHIIE